MPLIRLLVLTLVFSGAAFAHHFNHPLSASRADVRRTPRALLGADTVRVLAAMVQFQKDNDQSKDGNGQFVLSPLATPVIDPAPHDSAYFAYHLTFLANYFRKVSKGRTFIRWTLLDSVYTLRGVMYDYTPRAGETNVRLAQLARDSWHAVDSSGRVKDFSQYDCFMLFHAGVGHDIDLISTLSYDPAPHDLPSLYVGPSAFTSLLGGGIAVGAGAFTITNTIIMPETESRYLPDITGNPYLLQLGINGLLCASLGNYLGLPDLFNTLTGASGIGRFGLMDGESIFSWSGVFPPEPSAWEKYWLGWLSPITLPPGSTIVSAPAVALADSVYRVPISEAEYFLVENRNRDPFRTGQKITSVYNGVTNVQSFAHDTTGFSFDDISGLYGSIVDVDVFDWSLPGGVDVSGTFYDGGVLIWHIDEAVINAAIASDQVNANPSRRGVNLEEADGSQDIGQSYDILSPGSGSEAGTALDFWFAGNSSAVNTNTFSSTTHPNSNSNLGALSHVTIKDFSVRSPYMTLRVTRGDAVQPLSSYPRELGEAIASNALTLADPGSSFRWIVATSGIPLPRQTTSGPLFPPLPLAGGKLYLFSGDSAGSPFRRDGVVAFASAANRGFRVAPAIASLRAVPSIIAVESLDSSNGGAVRAFSLASATPESLAQPLFAFPFTGAAAVPPVVSDTLIAIGSTSGTTYFLRFDGTPADSIPSLAPVSSICRWNGANTFLIAYRDGTLRLTQRTTSGAAQRTDITRSLGPGSGLTGACVATGLFGADTASGKILAAVALSDGTIYLLDSALSTLPGFPVYLGQGLTSGPVLADIDGDGRRDIVLCGGNRIYAYSYAGVMLDNFPILIPSGSDLQSAVVGDVDGDGRVEIVAMTIDGVAYAYNNLGRPAPGFPLFVGYGQQSAALSGASGSITLLSASGDGSVSAWTTGRSSAGANLYPWPQYGKDARHSGLDATRYAGVPISSNFFPAERVYNWPNPVYSGKTYFRFYVSQDAAIDIKIFDLAGDLVTELSGRGSGGIDNEIAWDISRIQTGIYFARIAASGPSSSGVKIVKVAVVK
ncbi:MAG TPA: FG-GAP-like repeat-containing protein [Bacteroidota bacterium]|nr:FG-GAP-like repeat-containing protein [Bacteroidota bacterium]